MTLNKLVSVMGLSLILTAPTFAATDLVQQAKTENRTEQTHNVKREVDFKKTEQELKAEKAALVAKRNALQAEADKLSAQFSKNENNLARLEEKLRLETGSLGEIFGVVRQNAKEIRAELENSVTGVDRQQYASVIDDIVAAKSLPSMKQLIGLWHAMDEQIHASGEISTHDIAFIDGEGRTQTTSATRIGALGLVTEQGYVNWNNARKDAIAYQKQPDNGPTSSSLASIEQGDTAAVVLDPSRGTLLEQLAQAPTLQQRLEAGGVIGKIILVLLAVGLIIGVYRGIVLAIARQKIQAQLKTPNQPGNNPLGRILSVYNKEQNRSVEALELRLLEAVVDEQTGLEKGLSMLKLLAALAPMLGLLGTVTGMIETFQVITQFGNGDPKVMAGGISMALVTTVLGLVAAMPLLLAHNILSTQAENIRNILEKQGIGLVAEEAERECGITPASRVVGNAA
ncbi:MotA/TolQ/ExbB proton channel family protein [Vibrio fluvialis]|uniref:MotA/TolQ/ExbB proton channel family protein n=1 Tax=Vibrio sp. bablab_jr001 TaxID=2755067 RepID=UPI0018F22E79|nr:MotA/TolQ/ExbB proton channel family protein [Vibrio sp. bablab_jr001]EKO3397557.1 MotA/TolQ/ExbB proton channel family protein [Vibrio fluvialis]EKO3473155.1 MotA/TolQ/ExbB proton channel family protein [Vibrio fluvialis]MBY8114502.1 MotA/TolQ/ExbB proton channel family protein [Vibrio fluvialis]MBY8246828.1 MotA/TolQ/ExbB proton channel family protein [Vibrio fluvialis]MBY8280483.1 MotA/TolQ/ExbB proton channel family protein [Vibrio fluvialis]